MIETISHHLFMHKLKLVRLSTALKALTILFVILISVCRSYRFSLQALLVADSYHFSFLVGSYHADCVFMHGWVVGVDRVGVSLSPRFKGIMATIRYLLADRLLLLLLALWVVRLISF